MDCGKTFDRVQENFLKEVVARNFPAEAATLLIFAKEKLSGKFQNFHSSFILSKKQLSFGQSPVYEVKHFVAH